MFDKRRHFIIRAQQAKRATTTVDNVTVETVQINGRAVVVDDGNRDFIENFLAREAEQAFEAAVFRRPYESRLAIAA